LSVPEVTHTKNFYKLIKGDCIHALSSINENINCVIIDPPYSTPVITAFGRKKEKNYGDLSIQRNFFQLFKEQLKNKIKLDTPVFIFCDSKYYPILYEVFYEWETQQLLVWDKMRIGMGSPFRNQYELIYCVAQNSGLKNKNKGMSNIIKCKPCSINNRLVGSQKPLKLINLLIQNFTDKGDTVLDAFVGSGTTMIACQDLQRNCIGIEINPEYCEQIKNRCFSRTFLDHEVNYEFAEALV